MARGHVTIDGKPYILQDESYSTKPVPMFRPQLQVEGISHEALDQYLYMVQGTWDKGTNERQERNGWSGGTWRTMAGLDSSEAGKLRLQRDVETSLVGVLPPDPLFQAVANSPAVTGEWERSSDGVSFDGQTLTGLSSLWFDERRGAIMLALTATDEIQRSTDGGDIWSVLTALPAAGHNNACFEHSGGVILVGQPANVGGEIRVFRSTNGGVSWSDVLVATRIAGNSRVYPGTFVECDDGSILMHDDPNAGGSDDVQVYRSTDQGATWTLVLTTAAVQAALSYLYNQGIAYLLADDGVQSLQLYRSTNHGVTWADVAPAGMAAQNLLGASSKIRNAVARIPSTGEQIMVTASSFWRSTNQGVTWTEDAASSPGPSTRGAIAVTMAGSIFAVRDIAGTVIRRSTDNGASWTTLSTIQSGATNASMIFTAVTPVAFAATGKAILISTGGFLYAFMAAGDVFRTADGVTWSTVAYDDATHGAVTAVDLYVAAGISFGGAPSAPGGPLSQLGAGAMRFVAGTSTGRLWTAAIGSTLTPTVVSTRPLEITLVKAYRGHVAVGYGTAFEMWLYSIGPVGGFNPSPKYAATVPGVPVAAAVWNGSLVVLIQTNQVGSLLSVADLTQITDFYEIHGEFLGQAMATWGSELVYAGSRLNTQGEIYTFQENLSDLLPVTAGVPIGVRALSPSANYILAAHNGEAGLWWVDREGGGPLCGANTPGAAETRIIDSIAYFLGRPYFNLRNTGIMRMSNTTYRTSGAMETGWFTGGFPELTKEWSEVVVRLEAELAAGETVVISGRIDDDVAYTTIGSLTIGDISRVLTIPAALQRSKRFEIKCAMTGPGTSTPTVTALIARYLPRPVPMRVWGFTVKAFKGMTLLDGSKEHRTPEQIIDDLYGLMLAGQVSFSSVLEPTTKTVYAVNVQAQAQLLGKTQTDSVRAQEEAHIAVELLEALTSDFST